MILGGEHASLDDIINNYRKVCEASKNKNKGNQSDDENRVLVRDVPSIVNETKGVDLSDDYSR